jgi:hypothetical protein
MARQQVLHVQEMINETRDNIRVQLTDVRERVLYTVDEARETVMRPIRQYSAIAMAVAEGIKTFFGGRKQEVPIEEVLIEQEARIQEEHPAA